MSVGVKSVLNWTIGIAAIAFVLLIVVILFGNLSGNSGIVNVTNNVTVANETGAWINTTGYTLSGYNTSWSGITIITAINGSNGSVITSSLYTVASGILSNTTAAVWGVDDEVWLNYFYTNTATSQSETDYETIITNYTTGATNTSAQFPTVGTILGVALLILILLSLLVYVIIKMSGMSFGGGGSSESFQKGDFA